MLAGGSGAPGTRDPECQRLLGVVEPSRGSATASGSASARSPRAVGAFLLLRLHALAPARGRDARALRRPRSRSATCSTRCSASAAARRSTFCSPTSSAHVDRRPHRACGSSRSLFAVASIPVVGRARRAPHRPPDRARRDRLVAAASWTMLFHGIYGRMYSLFLFTSALSLLLLLRALERSTPRTVGGVGGRGPGAPRHAALRRARSRGRRPSTWRPPLRRPLPLRPPLIAFVAVACSPRRSGGRISSSRRASRSGSAGSGSELGSPARRRRYLWDVLGDFSAGWVCGRDPRRGRVRRRLRPPRARLGRSPRSSPAAIAVVPVIALVAARSGARRVAGDPPPDLRAAVLGHAPRGSGSCGARRRRRPRRAARRRVVLVGARRRRGRLGAGPDAAGSTPASPTSARRHVRKRPRGSRPPAVPTTSCSATSPLPRRVGRGRDVRRLFMPRADPKLAARDARGSGPAARTRRLGPRRLGRLDQDRCACTSRCAPAAPEFEARAFGPFLVIRTREPVGDPGRLPARRRCRSSSSSGELSIGDAGRNSSPPRGAEAAARGY